MRLGVHVPIAGGLDKALNWAQQIDCTTIQIFSRSPRGGKAPVRSEEALARFDAQRRELGIEPLAVHAPYIINLASPERAMWDQSLRLYQEEYRRVAHLKAQYLVTHVGSHRGSGEEAGIARVARALTDTLEQGTPAAMILLENTAGSGQGLGSSFEHLAAMREQTSARAHVGICLDTAHLFAAGFPIHTEAGLEEMCEAFKRIVGFAHLKLIHLNDSKSAFNSHVDRHWHLGEGQIGLDAMRRIVTHPRLRQVPLILETPKKLPTDDPRNLVTVRRLLGAALPPRRGRLRATSPSRRDHATP